MPSISCHASAASAGNRKLSKIQVGQFLKCELDGDG